MYKIIGFIRILPVLIRTGQKWSLVFKCQIKNCFYADVLEFAMERIWTSRDKSGLALQDAANSLPAFDVVICSRMHQVIYGAGRFWAVMFTSLCLVMRWIPYLRC
ncbi:hypothetical protein OUZ56_020524 [Daphnia magna]|uniref:Uncharacterized protein n=1 Tax=Daphnia magna TaxID=35525 RepID=A0ABQ9ZEQ2_9CRUS|nr:hypothetical protein OUZ56_020524 [Daphnia magna]